MWCGKCNRDLSECICPDLEERLNDLRKSKFLHVPSIVEKPLAQRKIREEQKRNRPDEDPAKQ